MRRPTLALAAVGAAAAMAALSACSGSGSGGSSGAAAATGPITVWLSNNQEEVTWGKAMVAAWNTAHADQKVTAQEIPAGKSSEEVIGAAITAGNAPCLVFNTSPAAVPQFQKQGGLVPLDDFPGAVQYVKDRSGKVADQYTSTDGKLYQLPWKSNPVMIFYNKKLFAKAGLDPDKPALSTYADFLATSKKIVDSKAAKTAIWPAPTSEFLQPWFDFYPLYAAATGGKQLIADGQVTFTGAEGQGVAQFWRDLYDQGLASREKYNGDSFADGQAAMAIVGPWAVSVYGEKVDWGVVPVPTKDGTAADQTWTFSDAKNVAMYSACTNRGTAWELMKFATSSEQDGKLLEATGQMPLRTDLPTAYAAYFKAHPDYTTFASQAARTVEVPNVESSVEIWQDFRDAWGRGVIFGKEAPAASLDEAAAKIKPLLAANGS